MMELRKMKDPVELLEGSAWLVGPAPARPSHRVRVKAAKQRGSSVNRHVLAWGGGETSNSPK